MSQAIKLIPTSGPGSGTVTSISAATGITLTPNPITATGTVGLTIPVVVTSGGTGFITATTAYAPIVAGTTPTGAFQVASTGLATAGFVLTSNGAAAVPSFQALPAGGVTSITGTTGGAQTGAITLAGGTTGLAFGGAAGTITTTFAGITANGGTVSLATDATGSIVDVGTGAGAKVVTLGSTNTASSLALRYGTADFTMASATGTIISALDTGEITYPLQPAFNAYPGTSPTNVTGDGTVYVIPFDTETFDQGSDFNTGTYTFTAPVTGRYQFNVTIGLYEIGAAHTIGVYRLVTTAAAYHIAYNNPSLVAAVNGVIIVSGSFLVPMTAGNTAYVDVAVYNSTKTVDLYSALGTVSFSGNLVC